MVGMSERKIKSNEQWLIFMSKGSFVYQICHLQLTAMAGHFAFDHSCSGRVPLTAPSANCLKMKLFFQYHIIEEMVLEKCLTVYIFKKNETFNQSLSLKSGCTLKKN